MKNVTIKIGNDDLEVLKDIFKSEADFKPQSQQDMLIVEILKQVLNNPKNEITDIEV